MEKIRHNCGLCVAHTLHDVYGFITDLQHRGREATGIAAVGDGDITVIKWVGPVNTFDLKDLGKIFPDTRYHTFLAHVRYATRGRKDQLLLDAHPHVIGGETIDRGSHVIIRGCEMAIVHNGQVDIGRYFPEVELPNLKTGCDTEKLLWIYKEKGIREILKKIPNSYTLAIADRNAKGVIVARDRMGVRPGVIGLMHGKHCMASEDIVFRKLRRDDGEVLENITPGYIFYLLPDGGSSKEEVVEKEKRHCFFEVNYIGDVDSVLFNLPVRVVRGKLGERLAIEFSSLADIVTYLPRCPEVAAMEYAKKTGLPFEPVFYKMRGERSFQGPDSVERAISISNNLHLLPGVEKIIKDKSVVVVDDSIIRGNNSKRAIKLLKEAGVAKIYFLSYTPPMCIRGKDGVLRGCSKGVDMPISPPVGEEYIARDRTMEEISEIMGAEVGYLSVEGMLDVFKKHGLPADNLCYFCLGGPNIDK